MPKYIDDDKKLVELDNHLLSQFLNCQRKGYYAIEEGIKLDGTANPLSFGIAMHKGVEVFNKCKAAHVGFNEAMHMGLVTFQSSYNKEMDPMWVSQYGSDIYESHSLSNGLRLLEGYFRKYYGEATEVLHAETPFALDLGTTPKHNYQVVYTGVMDAIIRFQGQIFVEELKTSGEFPSAYYFKKFDLLNSVTGYIYAAQEYMREAPFGCVVRAIWKQPPYKLRGKKPFTDWFQTWQTTRSQTALKEWYHNTLHAIDEFIDARQRGFFRMANSETCTMWGECEFFRLCNSNPDIRPIMIQQMYRKHNWDPLNR